MDSLVLREVQTQASGFGEGKYHGQLQDPQQASYRSWHVRGDVKGGEDSETEVGVGVGRKAFQGDCPA